jgi:hemerythrin-like domain-containing protein
MNRAPATWSNSREMYHVSEQRKQRHPDVICSSLSNVAISTRLHNKPQRFLWSGLQTYYDVIDFVEAFKEGLHPAIESDASIDFFSYSIGTFLGEILMMSNKDGHFTRSKYATFCGGAVFNRLSPVSKFILDSEANVSLYSYVVEHLESHMKRDEVLRHYMHTHPEGNNFRSMLNYRSMTREREAIFRDMSDQFYAVTLAKDEVVPTYEVINTLQGSDRDIPIKIETLDYPYKYIHEDPFPALPKIADEVDRQFRLTFDKISDFLK